ncbi:MAG: restriction endonuclease [bacterium]|nr:restriction endonuclease [bacterium]
MKIPEIQLAHLLHEALEQLGWTSDPTELANKVRKLNIGLPAEDEFSVILSWLGKCTLLHKLDQHQSPLGSKERYRVPDLLAFFSFKGRTLPALIEVKRTSSGTWRSNFSLSWKPEYYEPLADYGRTLGIPVLVAWKYHEQWSLFDLGAFRVAKKNYRISFLKAMQENLLGLLGGDFVFVLRPGVGMHIGVEKKELLKEEKVDEWVHQQWEGVVQDAYFTDGEGRRLSSLGRFFPLFLAAAPEPEVETVGPRVYQRFVAEEECGSCWGHQALGILLEYTMPADKSIDWRKLLLSEDVPVPGDVLRETASDGIPEAIVRYVINQRPRSVPPFLKGDLEEW